MVDGRMQVGGRCVHLDGWTRDDELNLQGSRFKIGMRNNFLRVRADWPWSSTSYSSG